MSINETQYRINITDLQNILKMIHSTPKARLEIEPNRVALIIQGKYAWEVHGSGNVAGVLGRTAERFFERDDSLKPIKPVFEGS